MKIPNPLVCMVLGALVGLAAGTIERSLAPPATAQSGSVVPIQEKPAPFVPRPVSARLISPPVNVLLVSVVVAPANPRRRGIYIWNNSANSGYCCFAATCTSASPTRIMATFTTWEPNQVLTYQGQISCIRNAGNGAMAVWELE